MTEPCLLERFQSWVEEGAPKKSMGGPGRGRKRPAEENAERLTSDATQRLKNACRDEIVKRLGDALKTAAEKTQRPGAGLLNKRRELAYNFFQQLPADIQDAVSPLANGAQWYSR